MLANFAAALPERNVESGRRRTVGTTLSYGDHRSSERFASFDCGCPRGMWMRASGAVVPLNELCPASIIAFLCRSLYFLRAIVVVDA